LWPWRKKPPEVKVNDPQKSPAEIVQELSDALANLQMARELGDELGAQAAEVRLNWLLESMGWREDA
jgi:hypothetical protein